MLTRTDPPTAWKFQLLISISQTIFPDIFPLVAVGGTSFTRVIFLFIFFFFSRASHDAFRRHFHWSKSGECKSAAMNRYAANEAFRRYFRVGGGESMKSHVAKLLSFVVGRISRRITFTQN